VGHPDLLKSQKLARDAAEHHPDRLLLLKDGTAKARIAKGDGEVGASPLLKLVLAAVRRDTFHQRRRVVAVEHLGIQALQAVVMADHRRLAARYVQVARLQADDRR